MLEQEFERRLWPDTAVALHVETTGGRSERQRILWIGLTRIAGGRIEETWETLVNPQARVPQHVARRLDLDVEALDNAPLAPQALADARSILGEEPIVGHAVLTHVGPLTYELLWHGLPALRGDFVDTQSLAAQCFGDLSRPALEAVARRLGLRPTAAKLRGVSRLVAEAYLALTQRGQAMETAVESLDALETVGSLARAYGAPPGAGSELPDLPGVYVFRDRSDAPLYVGKAASLRARVPQHFTGGSRAKRLDDGLLSRTARVEHAVTPTELHALLREVALVEELKPPYNTQRAAHRGTPYIVLRDPPFLRAAASVSLSDVQESFGPYETTRAVRETIHTLATVFQLRTCLRKLPATRAAMRVPCIRLGMGLCPAPCAELVDVAQYERRVALTRTFLRHGKDGTLDEIDRAQRDGQIVEWERTLLADVRSRLLRVRREHRPVVDVRVANSRFDVSSLTESERHVLARWARRSRSISLT